MTVRPLYTTDVHIGRLKEVLAMKDIKHCCPAAFGFSAYNSPNFWWSERSIPCEICLDFVGLDYDGFGSDCPCQRLGCDEARKRSEEAIIWHEKIRKYRSF